MKRMKICHQRIFFKQLVCNEKDSSSTKYLHCADHHSAKITKADKDFSKRLDFKDIKFPVETKCCEQKHVDLLLIGEEDKRHYMLIKDFNTFMYDQTLHRGRKHFCRFCLQVFSTEI